MLIYTAVFVYWGELFLLLRAFCAPYVTGLEIISFQTVNYGFCQDSGPGGLSVLSVVMTFINMSSVVSNGSCSLLPRYSTKGILNLSSSVKTELKHLLLRVSAFLITVVIFDLSISRPVQLDLT